MEKKMPSPTLATVLCFLPPRTSRKNRLFVAWKQDFKNLCASLAACTLFERRNIYTEARERFTKKQVSITERSYLWFFAHPSFAVFEDFWKDTVLVESFAGFVACLQPCLTTHGTVRSQKFKRLLNRTDHRGYELSWRYAALLSAHYPLWRIDPKSDASLKNAHSIILNDHPDNEAFDVWLKDAETQLICDKLNGALLHLRNNDRFYNMLRQEVPMPSFEERHPFHRKIDMDSLILSVEFNVRHTGWLSISKLKTSLYHTLIKGRWPTFTEERSVCSDMELCITQYEVDGECLSKFVHILLEEYQAAVDHLREIKNGLLPVGIKVHAVGKTRLRHSTFGYTNSFKLKSAEECIILPAVGSTERLMEILTTIKERTGLWFLNNPDFQIQVCSPGELTRENAAILGIVSYLGSDTLRRYALSDITTTLDGTKTASRPLIYGGGILDEAFEWWQYSPHSPSPVAANTLAALVSAGTFGSYKRTDVLACTSMHDIRLVNLVATLLIHTQADGYWGKAGLRFISEVKALLMRHHLSGLLDVEWIKANHFRHYESGSGSTDHKFSIALDELMNYAFAEQTRIAELDAEGVELLPHQRGILFEIQDIVKRYRTYIEGGNTKSATTPGGDHYV